MEVGEERVRKEVVVHAVKVDTQHLQDLSRYFKNMLLVKQIGQGQCTVPPTFVLLLFSYLKNKVGCWTLVLVGPE